MRGCRRQVYPPPTARFFFKNGKTGCLLRLSGGVERGAGDVTVLVPSEAGGRANPGSGPCHLSGVRTSDADPLQQPSVHRVAAGIGSGSMSKLGRCSGRNGESWDLVVVHSHGRIPSGEQVAQCASVLHGEGRGKSGPIPCG